MKLKNIYCLFVSHASDTRNQIHHGHIACPYKHTALLSTTISLIHLMEICVSITRWWHKSYLLRIYKYSEISNWPLLTPILTSLCWATWLSPCVHGHFTQSCVRCWALEVQINIAASRAMRTLPTFCNDHINICYCICVISTNHQSWNVGNDWSTTDVVSKYNYVLWKPKQLTSYPGSVIQWWCGRPNKYIANVLLVLPMNLVITLWALCMY